MGINMLKPQTRSTIITYAIVIVAFVAVTLLDAMGLISHSLSGQLVPICAYVSLAVSLNLVVGVSGELSLGHAGFMSVGAFTGVVVAGCLTRFGIESELVLFVLSAVVGAVAAGLIGFLVGIPVMRLRGDYLAIVTLAFGEIIKNLLNILYVGVDDAGLHFSMRDSGSLGMSQGTILINGPKGAVGIDKISTFVLGIVLVLITVAVVLNLMHSRDGRAIMAVRDNRIAAESIGINVTKYRLMAFTVASALAGAAGVLYAMNYSTVVPSQFDFNQSILILVYVVLGGMGNISGSIVSAAFLTVLPEVLRPINQYRMLLYAIVLILVMVVPHLKVYQRAAESLRRRFHKDAPEPAVAAEGGEADE
ncbi:branched-chain amino acid ABC transporter permease [Enorma burkinafasonensis]|uniref:branched-chain amino acid ABC transporter permease n=1 Tax=Enorma burkinafasonensis TaxID=2590867 RepID=UPI0026F13B21|nr:branched-chain amino acid ABC transporter permease [Enorma burkinafasonensis]MCI7730276.1 branched-chain amino acid ABC transporter permease [Enorma burkinafasonensis]